MHSVCGASLTRLQSIQALPKE